MTETQLQARTKKALADMARTELRLHASAVRLAAAERRFKALVSASVAMVWHMTRAGDHVYYWTDEA